VLATAHGCLAAAGEWALDEKRIVVERAGLEVAQTALVGVDPANVPGPPRELLDLPAWR